MLVSLIITLVILGLILYLIELLPIDGAIKTIIRILVIVICILYAIRALGFVGGGPYWIF